jgi:DNA-binding beta-propeller fold protein YncE
MRNATPVRIIAGLAVLVALLVLSASSSAAGFDFLTQWGSQGAGDGQFQLPEGIVTDGAGDVYVVDRTNERVQKFDSAGNFITKWGSSGTGDGQFSGAFGIARDSSGNLYVVDSFNRRVEKFSSAGAFIETWGWGVS